MVDGIFEHSFENSLSAPKKETVKINNDQVVKKPSKRCLIL